MLFGGCAPKSATRRSSYYQWPTDIGISISIGAQAAGPLTVADVGVSVPGP